MRIQSKWIILLLTSLLCYITLFPAIFSAVPLALLRFETTKRMYYLFVFCTNLILLAYFGFIKAEGMIFVLGYFLVCFIATLAAELLLKYYAASRPLVEKSKNLFWNYYLGLGMVPIIVLPLIGILFFQSIKPQESMYSFTKQYADKVLSEPSTQELLKEIKKSSAPEAEQVIHLLENSEAFASQLLFALPSYVFVGYVILAFFTIFFLSRLNHFLGSFIQPDWVKEVVNEYRNPDIFIVFAIIVLAWSLFFPQLPLNDFWMKHGQILGSSLINVIGVFFFFQGLMVCLQLLDRWGIKGFFGALLIFVILLLVTKAVAVLGLLDMWLDFRNRKFGLSNNKSK